MAKNIVIAIPQLSDGGAERVASIWANKLAEMQYNVTVLLFHRTQNEYKLTSNVRCISLAHDKSSYEILGPSKKIRLLRVSLKKISPDYVISLLPSMQVWIMLASIGLKFKRIDTIRVNPWKIEVTNPFYRMMWKLSYHTCDKIIVQASDQIPWFNKSAHDKIILVPNPISEIYNKETQRPNKPINKFIAVGRIVPQKNYVMMIDAFAKAVKIHDNISLRIYGKGSDDYVNYLNTYIQKIGMDKHIHLMGRSENIEREYNNSDCFLMTSDFEGLPNALMEAMASQLICISTDCKTGLRDLIANGENGFLVPVGDSSNLASTICSIVDMEHEDVLEITSKAREKIMNDYSIDRAIGKLCELLQ